MREPRSSEQFAEDPQSCPVCGYQRKWGGFSFDGTYSWSDESCERCGAQWQTQWKALGYGESLSVPFPPPPDLCDTTRIWNEALREVFPLGGFDTQKMVGYIRHTALMSTWKWEDGERRRREVETPMQKFLECDVSLDHADRRPDELYGLVASTVINRLKDVADRAGFRIPSQEDQSEMLAERGYSIRRDRMGWLIVDEDGIALPIRFPSHAQARLGAYLHSTAIVPIRAPWEAEQVSTTREEEGDDAGVERFDGMEDDLPSAPQR